MTDEGNKVVAQCDFNSSSSSIPHLFDGVEVSECAVFGFFSAVTFLSNFLFSISKHTIYPSCF